MAPLYHRESGFTSIRASGVEDEIEHIEDPDDPGREISRDYDQLILDTIDSNLQAVGYEKVDDPEADVPDLYVFVNATTSTHTATNMPWGPIWGWYPGLPSWGYDWNFYFPYYGGGGVYKFATGSILIYMVDAREVDPDKGQIPVIWNAILNGPLSDSGLNSSGSTAARLEDAINRAFAQSPYLGYTGTE